MFCHPPKEYTSSILNWLTNDGQYMTLNECMNNDYGWIGLLIVLLTVVILAYFTVAVTAWKEYKKSGNKSPVSKGFVSLTLVFAFCAITGYAMDILNLIFPAYKLKALFLIPLSVATFQLIFFLKHHGVIQRMFELEKELKKLT